MAFQNTVYNSRCATFEYTWMAICAHNIIMSAFGKGVLPEVTSRLCREGLRTETAVRLASSPLPSNIVDIDTPMVLLFIYVLRCCN